MAPKLLITARDHSFMLRFFLLLPCTILHLLTQFGFLGLSYCRSFCRRGQPEESNHNSSSKKLHGEWFFLYMVWFVISKKKKKKVNKNKNKTKEKKRKDKFGNFFQNLLFFNEVIHQIINKCGTSSDRNFRGQPSG